MIQQVGYRMFRNAIKPIIMGKGIKTQKIFNLMITALLMRLAVKQGFNKIHRKTAEQNGGFSILNEKERFLHGVFRKCG